MFLKSFVSTASLMLAAHMVYLLIQASFVASSLLPLLPVVWVLLIAGAFTWAEQNLLKALEDSEEDNDNLKGETK